MMCALLHFCRQVKLTRVTLLLLCLTLIQDVGSPAAIHAAERPNIVLIMCDDMGWSDIGCYGGEIETPNLDRLAKLGMRFRTFYNNAKCEHTRASLLTGQWWHHVGASAKVHYAAPTFGERLRAAGYRTLMTGKWHAGQTPYQRGFDRYYGITDGCCNFWNPGHARPGEPEPAKKRVRRWAEDDQEYLPFTPEDDDFYTTDAFTDHAIEYLQEYKDEKKPFLLYLAYTAPHYPLHASPEDVAEYRGKYRKIGWDKLRQQRFARQQKLGILPNNTALSDRDPDLPAWEEVPEEERDQWDLRMATYAAMIDRMDRNIGRLLGAMDDLGKLQNTVIFFLSDNGACEDSADRSTVKGSMPWEVTSYLTQGRNWANASNTPFRKYKTTDYEGGTRTPMIAYWPGVIPAGRMTDDVGHLIDFMPTMLELAESPDAKEKDAFPGHSLVQTLQGKTSERSWPIYWQFGKAKAVRDERYKLVQFKNQPWELYDLRKDPTERINLAESMPEKAASLRDQWDAWWSAKGVWLSANKNKK
ncbi:MAG: arylsulfatase [Planctomycetota bacterium]